MCLVLHCDLHISESDGHSNLLLEKKLSGCIWCTLIATLLLKAGNKLQLNSFEVYAAIFTLHAQLIILDALQHALPARKLTEDYRIEALLSSL